ncbi:MAG: DUF996 domain-containing protein [Acidilobaceae archaeon]|nr:DUF996 domain-containing protein [Acidilobaceae archaeon]MDW7974676.1 DUF996 domain-containing protein [Sulfolobales archaeon]
MQGHEVNSMSASSKISVGPLELEFGTAKVLGAVGALLFLLGFFFPLLSIVGVILVLISLYYFSKLYGNPYIFTNYVYSVVLFIVASVLVVFGFVGGFVPFLFLLDPLRGEGEVDVGLLGLGVIALAVLLYALLFLGSMFFYYRALVSMAASSQVRLFSYAGLSGIVGGGLLFAGILLLIIVIGALFMFLGYLALIASAALLLVAFLQLKEPQPSPPPQPIEPAAPA